MKQRFLYHLFLVVIASFVLVSGFYYLICFGLRHARQDAVGRYNYITSDTTYYNAVFFGASTIRLGVEPRLFDSITGSNSFNAGMDGIGMAEINVLVKKYLNHHEAPLNIFVAFNENTLNLEGHVWYFPQYYPYVNDTDLNEIVRLEPKLLLGKYLPAIATTFFDDPLKNLGLIGLLRDYSKQDYSISMKGFAIDSTRILEDLSNENASFNMSDKGLELLTNTLDLCHNKGIHVSFIIPPIYNCNSSDSCRRFIAKLKSFENEYDTEVYTYIGNENFNSKDLFCDRIHVNAVGARILTQLLAEEYLKRHHDSITL